MNKNCCILHYNSKASDTSEQSCYNHILHLLTTGRPQRSTFFLASLKQAITNEQIIKNLVQIEIHKPYQVKLGHSANTEASNEKIDPIHILTG